MKIITLIFIFFIIGSVMTMSFNKNSEQPLDIENLENSENDNSDDNNNEAIDKHEDLHAEPGFLQQGEIESSLEDNNNEKEEEAPRPSGHFIKRSFGNKRNMNKHKQITELPGYFNSRSKTIRPSEMRFSQLKQNDDYFNPNQSKSDPNTPGQETEIIRQEGLSNGVILSDNKRTANFETGEFPDMYTDLTN